MRDHVAKGNWQLPQHKVVVHRCWGRTLYVRGSRSAAAGRAMGWPCSSRAPPNFSGKMVRLTLDSSWAAMLGGGHMCSWRHT